MKNWFPSEFTWRLYVVLQVAALMAFVFLLLALLANGELLEYRSIYEEVEFDMANVEAKCARGEGGSIFEKYNPETDPAKRLQSCINYETKPRFVGKELVGIDFKDVTFVLIWFVLAFVIPFAVVRVPTWLWEGWRESQ